MPTATRTRVDEHTLETWTKPAFNNEDEKAKDTEAAIREAISGHQLLSRLPLDVYAKGSIKNNTNVRRDSDVDVAVEYTGIIFSDYPEDTDPSEVRRIQGLSAYRGPFRDVHGHTDLGVFKNALGDALVSTFGSGAVTRHNKVFTVRESSRSLAADVIPCATYRKSWTAQHFAEGIRLLPDRPATFPINNYPKQHYAKGVASNNATSRRFKRTVRILKNLENKMVKDGTHPEVASYLVECLVYNAPKICFGGATWASRTRAVLLHIWEQTEDSSCEKQWVEVNGIKYLFHTRQKWTRDEARDFVRAAWQYVKDI
jgi:hypothetical protein